MAFKDFLQALFGITDYSRELITAKATLQQTANDLQKSQLNLQNANAIIATFSSGNKQALSEIASLEMEVNDLVQDNVKLKAAYSELQLASPEQETQITKEKLLGADLLDGYVFHTARPVIIDGKWKSQHFDVRMFSMIGDWSLKAICQLIVDKYAPETPEDAMLAVFKWQSENVKYRVDSDKWREGDNWGLAWEVLLTELGTYPADVSYYELLKSGKLQPFYQDDCESKAHLTKALCMNMQFVDPKLKIPDENVWISYGMWSGFGHAWITYWDPYGSIFRIYEATGSIAPSTIQGGIDAENIYYDEYFGNNSKYVYVKKGKAVVFG